ncbi:hypothetical protein CSIM01_07084 [Colletotrichum simmondsii]|uniref:Uncharacterized protein n=1 Tax=Colletotrichum simmondsii TaxID=703756 RepID=A0A135RT93_9PEZI|nr:hypothetical protein CSIM01_07084 [Colletotrichum simmondsii]
MRRSRRARSPKRLERGSPYMYLAHPAPAVVSRFTTASYRSRSSDKALNDNGSQPSSVIFTPSCRSLPKLSLKAVTISRAEPASMTNARSE